MVSQQPQLSPAMEMLLLGGGNTGAPGAPATPTAPPGSGAVDPALVPLLTGEPAPVPPLGGGEAQVLAPPSPMGDQFPVQPPPPEVAGPAGPGPNVPNAGNINLDDPSRAYEADIREEFYRRHGRAPTMLDMQAIRAMPILEQNLGRPPRRIEILQHLAGRKEMQSSPPLQFQPTGLQSSAGQGGQAGPAGPAGQGGVMGG